MADSIPTISAGGSSPQKTTGRTLRKPTKAKPAAKGVPTAGARLAQWLANPGLRSRLPDSALPADLLATRQQNAYGAAPAAPGSSYTNSDLSKLVDMLTSQKFGPAEAALKTQNDALNLRSTKEIPAWFQAYRDQIAGAQGAQKVAGDQLVGSLQQMATNASGDTGALAGAPMDAAGAARAQAAAQIRSAGIGNQAALAQNLNGIQGNYLTNQGLLSVPQQQSALLGVGKQQTDLATKIAQLASDKGDYKTTQRQQILSDESDQALKNALTTAQVGSTNASAAATKASTTKTKVETKKSKADQDYFKQHGYYPSTGKKTPDTITSGAFAGYTKTQVANMDPKTKQTKIDAYNKTKGKGAGTTDKDAYGNTTKQRTAAQDSFDKAQRLAKQYKPNVKTESELVDFLVGAKNVNIAMAKAAAQAAFHEGRVGPKTKGRLKHRGVTKFPKGSPPIGKQTATVVDQAMTDLTNLLP